MTLALFGKHRGFGDFLSAGELPGGGSELLMDWITLTLGGWRETAGPDWQAAFDAAPALRFWLGAGLAGGVALRGVALPSRDRSGRRFPLLIAQGHAGAAPVSETAQTFYEAAEAELRGLQKLEHFDPRETAALLEAGLPAPGAPHPATGAAFWATNAARAPQDLLAELAGADFSHAQAGRSYWWFAARADEGLPSGLLAGPGLPGPAEMGWLLSGGRPAPHHEAEA
ncbi:MAG: type VI secretion system-associated protein TagF [Paracoccus sp. (in: a-proteobacteria)]|nr:type VI secretion system-associated protein TagF [Paracoccus sp. (in: a-proteobacteria)]